MTDNSVILAGMPFRYLPLSDTAVVASLAKGLFPEGICVFSDEWANRREQCQSFILAKLGRFDQRVGARSCVVREVPKQEATAFLDSYHIQGSNHLGIVCFGLYEKEELLGLLSLGRHSRQIAQSRIVLDRLCFRRGVQVIGGASKLLQHAIGWAKQHNYREIVSFSDNRWTDGTIYTSLGFKLDQSWAPDYCYVKDGVRVSKQSQKKDVSGCPEGMTELEWAHAQGLVRVYDAGKKRWVLNLWPGLHEIRTEKNSKKCAEQHRPGVFKHSHIRGHFPSKKNGASIYFGSSYELRCLFLLEADPAVAGFRRCDTFKGAERWRNPDLWVDFVDGRSEVWEVKPEAMLVNAEVQLQVAESLKFATERAVVFRVWTEKDSGLKGEHEIIDWAREYAAKACGDPSYLERQKEGRKRIRERYYERHFTNDKVEVWCEFCQANHTALRKTYEKNIARNGEYVCERYGGHLAGKKPKLALRKTNPYAGDGKKQCSQCKEVLELSQFGMRKASWDGRSVACNGCVSKLKAARYSTRKVAKPAARAVRAH